MRSNEATYKACGISKRLRNKLLEEDEERHHKSDAVFAQAIAECQARILQAKRKARAEKILQKKNFCR